MNKASPNTNINCFPLNSW